MMQPLQLYQITRRIVPGGVAKPTKAKSALLFTYSCFIVHYLRFFRRIMAIYCTSANFRGHPSQFCVLYSAATGGPCGGHIYGRKIALLVVLAAYMYILQAIQEAVKKPRHNRVGERKYTTHDFFDPCSCRLTHFCTLLYVDKKECIIINLRSKQKK